MIMILTVIVILIVIVYLAYSSRVGNMALHGTVRHGGPWRADKWKQLSMERLAGDIERGDGYDEESYEYIPPPLDLDESSSDLSSDAADLSSDAAASLSEYLPSDSEISDFSPGE